jgi:3-methyl-2-oxobutanoate hydroxymethyltransferase
LVLHDVIGLFPWFRPKFAEPRADIAGEIQRAARAFAKATKSVDLISK